MMQKWEQTLSSVLIFFCLFFLLPHQAFSLNLDELSAQPLHLDQSDSQAQPFLLQAEVNSASSELVFNFRIAPNYHLYQSQFSLDSEPHLLGAIQFPDGESIQDPLLGPQVIYHTEVSLKVPLYAKSAEPFRVSLHYQGCKGSTFCLPPMERSFQVDPQQHQLSEIKTDQRDSLSTAPLLSDQKKPASFFWTLLSFLGLGLLLSFSPCVLPMLPIITGILMESHQHSLKKELQLSAAFVMGNTCILTLLGFGAVFLGSALQAWLQTLWFIGPVTIILFIMGLSLLDYIHLHIPTHWLPQSKKTNRSIYHALFLGAFSGLIFSPCVSAPLVGALMFITTTHEYWVGGSALFLLGIGMGLPLMGMAIFGTHILPKRGPWMNQVKVLFAVLLFGLCIYLLSRVTSAQIVMSLYSLLCLGYGTYLLRITRTHQSLLKLILNTIGLSCLLYGTSLFFGLMMGNTDLLHPLKFPDSSSKSDTLPWITVVDENSLLLELQKAQQQGKIAIIDVYASWCIACHHIDQLVLPDPQVQKNLTPLVRIRFDMTHTNQAGHLWLKNHHIFGPPAQVFFDTTGQWISQKTLYGEISIQQLIDTLSSLR